MRFAGFDPSTASCGWAVVDGRAVVAAGSAGCPFFPTPDTSGLEAAYSGAVVIWALGLAEGIVAEHGVTDVAIEEPIQARGKTNTNNRTLHLSAVMFASLSAGAVRGNAGVWGVAQQSWRSKVGVSPPPRGSTPSQRTAHNKREALRVCRQRLRHEAGTHDEAEAALIADWLAMQRNPKLAVAGTLFQGVR